jgi:hypothetical protein
VQAAEQVAELIEGLLAAARSCTLHELGHEDALAAASRYGVGMRASFGGKILLLEIAQDRGVTRGRCEWPRGWEHPRYPGRAVWPVDAEHAKVEFVKRRDTDAVPALQMGT